VHMYKDTCLNLCMCVRKHVHSRVLTGSICAPMYLQNVLTGSICPLMDFTRLQILDIISRNRYVNVVIILELNRYVNVVIILELNRYVNVVIILE